MSDRLRSRGLSPREGRDDETKLGHCSRRCRRCLGGSPPPQPSRATTTAASRPRSRPMLTGSCRAVGIDGDHLGGRRLPSGYRFEAIPDGISVRTRGQGTADIFVNHETSLVPFPLAANADRCERRRTTSTTRSEQAAPQPAHAPACSTARFVDPEQRRLPAFLLELPRRREGGIRPRHPVHERGGARLRPPPGGLVDQPCARRPGAEQAGVVVALRRRRAASLPRSTAWAGPTTRTASRSPASTPVVLGRRHVHERPHRWWAVRGRACPRSRSSTRTCAPSTAGFWNDEGICTRSSQTSPTDERLRRRHPGSGTTVTGHFIKVPRTIATGQDGRPEVKAADFGYPAAPNHGESRATAGGSRRPAVGARALERTSTTSSSSSGSRTSPTTSGRAWRTSSTSPTPVRADDRRRPRHAELTRSHERPHLEDGARRRTIRRRRRLSTVLVEGDDNPVKTLARSISPTTSRRRRTDLLVTRRTRARATVRRRIGRPALRTARLWHVRPRQRHGAGRREGQPVRGRRPDRRGPQAAGAWGAGRRAGSSTPRRSFGPGAFLIDVQAHTLGSRRPTATTTTLPPGPTSRTSGKAVSCCCCGSPNI